MKNIRFGEVLKASNDKGPFKLVDIQVDGKEVTAELMEPYGVAGSPIEKGRALVFYPDGDEGKAMAIMMPPPADRVDAQEEGEITYKNLKTDAEIKHTKDGDIVMKSPNGIIHINPPE